MSKSPNLYDCTAKELADWILQAKREEEAIMFPSGFLFSSQAQVLAEAYRIVGYKEGYKRGKRDGSYAGYNVGCSKGFDDGYSSCVRDNCIEWNEEEWYK